MYDHIRTPYHTCTPTNAWFIAYLHALTSLITTTTEYAEEKTKTISTAEMSCFLVSCSDAIC